MNEGNHVTFLNLYIDKRITIEMSTYTANERQAPYNPKFVVPQMIKLNVMIVSKTKQVIAVMVQHMNMM